MLVKKKMFCPGSGNELLSTLGGSLECHASSIVLVPLDSNIAGTTKGFAFLFSLSFLVNIERAVFNEVSYNKTDYFTLANHKGHR